jgi:hypothetical protein
MPALWLAKVLRDAGLRVVEVPGWKTRGSSTFAPKAVMIHHTATGQNWSTEKLTNLLVKGRPDLRGPLCNLQLDRDGTFRVVAAGRANHAGRGSWPGLTAGNTQTIGIEAANDGRGEPWPLAQREAMAVGSAALLRHLRASEGMLLGHKEWAPKRKIDPRGIDMGLLRGAVRELLAGAPPPKKELDVSKLPVVKRGSRGDAARRAQGLLAAAGALPIEGNLDRDGRFDGLFGPSSEGAVKRFQQRAGLPASGQVNTATWTALLGI